jgi:hypothetical protein
MMGTLSPTIKSCCLPMGTPNIGMEPSRRLVTMVQNGFPDRQRLSSLAFCTRPSRSAISIDWSIQLLHRSTASELKRCRSGNPFCTIVTRWRDGSIPIFGVPIGKQQDLIVGLKNRINSRSATRRRSLLSAHTAARSSDF